MKYIIVKLKTEIDDYIKLGLSKNSLGLILTEKEDKVLVMFFNTFNQGDYLISLVEREHLEMTDIILPKQIRLELEEYIQSNADKIIGKTKFEEIPFNECDHVELIVNKEKYLKYGLNKGSIGVIASNKAIKNKILVDFGNETEDFDGFVSVDFEDIIKVEK